MRTFFVQQQTGTLTSGRSQGDIGNPARGGASAVNAPWGAGDAWKLGFLAAIGDQTNADLGTTIDGALILKEITTDGARDYDGPALTSCVTWTKRTDLGDSLVWYTGTLDLARLELAKLLGVSVRTAKEKLLVQCVADVDGSLDGSTLKIAIDATHFIYFDFYTATGVATVPGTGNFQDTVTIAANDADTAVATALTARINATTANSGFTATASGANVTLTKSTVVACGQHDPLGTGFALQLLAIGGNAGALADIASVTLNAEFSYVVSSQRQICKKFQLGLDNSLYRSGQTTTPSGLTVISSLEVPIRATGVTGYIGGSGNLDGIATASGAIATGQVVWFIHATEGFVVFELVAGTDAEASPAVIRPDDYNAGTNARVWKQAS
jgi:hypothetical protein